MKLSSIALLTLSLGVKCIYEYVYMKYNSCEAGNKHKLIKSFYYTHATGCTP
jgi:hypothetical protein